MAAERCSYEILIRGSKVGHTALTQIDVNSSMVTLALIRPRCEINMSQIIYNHTSFGVVGHMLRTFFFFLKRKIRHVYSLFHSKGCHLDSLPCQWWSGDQSGVISDQCTALFDNTAQL